MASNTAWMVGLNDPGLSGQYDRLSDSMSRPPLPEFPEWAVVSPRLLTGTVENLRSLGIEIDSNNAVLKGLRAGIMTGYSLYMLYRAVAALRKAEALKEAAIAAGETTALAIAQQWHMIAQGVAAAALVSSAFAVGEKFGSGDWNFPSVNLSLPTDRRRAIRQLESVQ